MTEGKFQCGGKVTATLQTRTNNGRSIWVLDKEVHYTNDRGVEVIVPVGFETDFASVPRLFWRLIPPIGPCGAAAVIHDYLYVRQGAWERKDVDALFLECLEILGAPSWRRDLMWIAVRLGGWIGWRKYKKKKRS